MTGSFSFSSCLACMEFIFKQSFDSQVDSLFVFFEKQFLVGNLKFMLYELMSAFFEVYLGFLVTILSFSPRGSLQLTSCYTSEVNLSK